MHSQSRHRPPHRYPCRSSYRRSSGRRFRRRRGAPFLLFALIAAVVLSGAAAGVIALAGTVLAMVAMVGATVGAATALVKFVRMVRRARRSARPAGGSVRLPEPRPAAEDWRGQWRAARRRFDQLRTAYAGYECDPLEVLRLPALADVTVPSTARFVDAFAEAQALHSDDVPPREFADSYRGAVDRAWQSWRAARDAAERIRLAGLTPEERASVQRVIKLLTMARDSGIDAERAAAYAKARAELAKLERGGRIHVPRPALAILDEAARTSLPVGGRPPAEFITRRVEHAS